MALPPTFASTLDRLEAATASLHVLAAAHAPAPARPSFARAVLHARPAALIREAAPWELALFARVAPPPGPRAPALDAAGAPAIALGPAPDPQQDALEPEDYAQAGVNMLQRYEAIRPMPRAKAELLSILEQCATERTEIAEIEARRLETQLAPAGDGPDLARLIKEEEARFKAVQKDIERLIKRRDELLKQKRPSAAAPARRPPPPSAAEAAFWDTPDPGPRIRKPTSFKPADDDLLTGDLPDVSADFGPASPTPAPVPVSAPAAPPAKPIFDFSKLAVKRTLPDDEYDDEPTVLLAKPPLSFSPPPVPPPTATEPRNQSPSPASWSPEAPALATPEPEKQPEAAAGPVVIRITGDVSNVFAKMWAAIGDTLLPGRNGTPLDDASTIAHLEALADGSDAGAPHARLVLALLRAPGAALPLALAQAAAGGPKVLYACVAKRLVRIERGGGEQTVRFAV